MTIVDDDNTTTAKVFAWASHLTRLRLLLARHGLRRTHPQRLPVADSPWKIAFTF